MWTRLKKPKSASSQAECENYALWLLSKRWWGTAELTKRLKEKGFEAQPVAQTLEKLKSLGYMDDRRLLERLVAKHIEAGNFGPLLLKQKILQKSFKENEVATLVKKLYTTEKQKNNLEKLVIKSGLDWQGDEKIRAKLYQRLIRRGFESALILGFLRSKTGDFADR